MKILTNEELKIVNLFRENLFREYTIREIMNAVHKNSYSWIFKTVKKLNKLGMINIKKKGNSNICSINLNNYSTITYLSLIEQINWKLKKLPQKNILELINSIPLSYFTFIITGSYASGKATKKSDLDIVVLTEDNIDTKKILTILKNKGELMIPEIHPYVFTKSEFMQMLLSDEENYGKMIFKNNLIIFGAENYYLIIKEAIRNGFKG